MANGWRTLAAYALYLVLLLGAVLPNYAHPTTTLSSSTTKLTLAGQREPKKIEPPEPKFKTTADPILPPELDFKIFAKKNLSYYDDDQMFLATTEFMSGMYQARLPVGNGYWGTTLPAAGPFFEMDVNQTSNDGNVTEGWPLFNNRQTFATISGLWDSQPTTPRTNFPDLQKLGWESVISGIPFPLGLHLVIGDCVLNSTVDRKTISNYHMAWRLRDGSTRWNFVFSPPNTKVSFEIEYTAFVTLVDANGGATELRVKPRGGNFNATIIDLLDGRSAQRSHLVEKDMLNDIPQIYVGIHPEGLPNVKAYVISTAAVSNGYTIESSRRLVSTMGCEKEQNMTIGQEWDVNLIDEEAAIFRKFIGVASSDKFKQPKMSANSSSTSSARNGWDATLLQNTQAWNSLMDREFMASYRDPSTGKLPENDKITEEYQITAVVGRHTALINLLPEDGSGLNDRGVPPTGLSSDSYGGMVFWDQDLWMFPAMAATNPEYAMQIPKSRVKQYAQAMANAQTDYVKEYYNFDNKAVLYAWMSGRYGNATGTGPVLNYQYHLNTDIALSMLLFRRITGNETYFRQKLWPVIESVGHTVTTLLQKDGNGWSILNMTDPDEYAASVDNGAYTLASTSELLQQIISIQEKYGEDVNQTWRHMADNVNIPRSTSGITPEYYHMPNEVIVKQGDVSLMSYPWHYNGQNYTLENKQMDLAYYNQKQNPDGPAMTFAINAIVENQDAASGCASFTYHHKATNPYSRMPWHLMSEVPNDDVNGNGGVPPAFPFITGHGGAAQIPLFGNLGLDLTQDNLTINPSLPVIPYLGLPVFYFQGARFKATMNSTHTNLTRITSQNTSVIHDVYADRSMPVVIGSPKGRRQQESYSIAVNQTLIINNDMYWKKASTEGNLIQCQATTSQSDNVLGQWPGAATDGNKATYWQPLTTKQSNITVDTSHVPFQRVAKININWGARPPLHAKVGFTNSSYVKSFKDSHMKVVNLGDITANVPYHILNETEPVPYIGNTTEHLVKVPKYDFLHRKKAIYTGKYVWLEIDGCRECGAMNSWTGGNNTKFNPEENTFGATVAEFEIISALGMNVVG